MRAGALDRRLTVMRSVPFFDGAQTTKGPAEPLFSRACSVEWVKDGERQAASETQASASARFVVRHDSDTETIDETDGVEFEGRAFEIIHVKPLPGRRVGFEISARGRAEG